MVDLVTGAFGNSGGAIAGLLLAAGHEVRTLTDSPAPLEAGTAPPIDVFPYRFDDPRHLAAAFDGVTTFYNTYWVRRGDGSDYEGVETRSRALVRAAERAGVERIVHLSVANPSLDSPYPYFRAKATIESVLNDAAVPAAIVRPALMFGGRADLLHDLAWLLRRSPVFGVAGDGDYLVRPVHVDDVARLCVSAGGHRDVTVVDAVGPERLSLLDLVTRVRNAVGSRALILRLPVGVVLLASKVLGAAVGVELLTRDELLSTMDGLADTDGPATGTVALTEWLPDHASTLGRRRPAARG